MRSDYKSMTPFDSRCEWWLPNSDRRVSGTVAFDGKRPQATLHSWPNDDEQRAGAKFDVIHGTLPDGTPVTATYTFVKKRDIDNHLTVNQLFVGSHLDSFKNSQFISATFQLSSLNEWYASPRGDMDWKPDKALHLEFRAPVDKEWSVASCAAQIRLMENRRSSFGNFLSNVSVQYETAAQIEPVEPKGFDWYFRHGDAFRQLLSLCMDAPSRISGVTLKHRSNDGDLDDVEFFAAPLGSDDTAPELDWHEMLLRFSDVEADFGEILDRWFAASEVMQMPRSLLFSTELAPGSFMDSQFLPVIQGLEVLFTATGSAKYISEAEYAQIKERIFCVLPNDIDPKLLVKLKSGVGFANELSLHDRIAKLLNSLASEIAAFVCVDVEKFSKWLKDSRNYFTHYGTGKHLSGLALHWATVQAALLLRLALMKDCGVKDAVLLAALNRSYRRCEGRRLWAEIESGL